MNQEPRRSNLHPEAPPVLTGQEARQGTLHERSSGRRWLFLALLIGLVTVLALAIYLLGGSAAPPGTGG